MKKKRLKIKWLNVIKLILLLGCVYMILHDLYYVLFCGYGWTWLGFITFFIFFIIAGTICEDFDEEIKSIHSYQPRHAKDTRRK